MNPLEMVVAIVLIVTASKIIQTHLRNKGQQVQGNDVAEIVQMRAELRTLKERIAVLERVVTDNHTSLDLDREIARLRDR